MKKRKTTWKGHSRAFWKRKFEEYKQFIIDQVEKGNAPVIIYETERDYRDAWVNAKIEADAGEGTKDITARLKWESMYNTKIKVAYGFRESLRDMGIQADVKTLRKMTHQEIIDKYEDQIKKAYRELKASGLNPTLAGQIISENWFRSP